MKTDGIRSLLLIIFGLALATACGDILGSNDSPDPIDWENGDTIETGDEGVLSEEEREMFRDDAEKLAVRYLMAEDSTETVLPEKLIELLYNGFIHIANVDHEKVDEVLNEYEIHARTPASAREVLVYADSAASWVDAWREGETLTSNADVDALIEEFDMTLVDFSDDSSETARGTLRSGYGINVYAVGRQFEEIEEIESAGPDEVTDGNEVGFALFDDHVRYVFEYGFGDCPSGCTNRHAWHFNVYEDGTVQYVGEEGDTLPENEDED